MTVTTSRTQQDDLAGLVHLVREGAEANERPDLVRRMRTAAEQLTAGSGDGAVAATVVRALESLEVDLRTRRAALCDPGRDARLAAESRHAEVRLRRYQDLAAKWPRLLSDALAALDSDVEYAVQSRLRALLDEGTTVLESAGRRFDSDTWLRDRLIAEAEAYQEMLRTAAGDAVRQVAAALELDEPVPAAMPVLQSAGDLVGQLGRRPQGPPDRPPLATRLVGIVMPTYSGIMVALILPRFFGLNLPLWLIVTTGAAGAIGMGGAALAGERQRQRSRRTADAVNELRSGIDAFRMAVTKQVRDGVRGIDRELHAAVGDAVARRTRRLGGTADEAKDRAEDRGRTERALQDVDADLGALRDLKIRAQRLI